MGVLAIVIAGGYGNFKKVTIKTQFQIECKRPNIRDLLVTGCIEECSSFRVGQAAAFLGWERVKRNTVKD